MSRRNLDDEVFILGAQDPEMGMIERDILIPLGLNFEYAMQGGERVTPGNAYKSENVSRGNEILIECGGPKLEGMLIDHHNPGNPGFSLGPNKFMIASSIGQLLELVIEGVEYSETKYYDLAKKLQMDTTCHGVAGPKEIYLDSTFKRWEYPGLTRTYNPCGTNGELRNVVVPEKFVLQAAADHCLAAAYARQCPGVEFDKLRELQIRNIANGTEKDFDTVRVEVERFKNSFKSRKPISFGRGKVFDFTDIDLGEGYSLPYLSLKEAGTISGSAYLVRHRFGENEPQAIMLSNATPKMVQFFLDVFAKEKGLVDTFANPQKSYAGGYLRE